MADLFDEIIQIAKPTEKVDNVRKLDMVETTKVMVLNHKTGEQRTIGPTQKILKSVPATKRPICYLNIKYANSVNLGDYQSAKVEKGLLMPVGAEKDPLLMDQIRATDEWASKLLESLIDKELDPILKSLKEKQDRDPFGK
jgi:hypothetical protein